MLIGMGVGEVLLVIVGSSAGAALINWAASWRTTKSQQNSAKALQTQKESHEGALQSQKEKHEAKLRRDAAHDDARDTFLPAAESITLYITKVAYDRHWDEVGIFVFPDTNRTLPANRAEVTDALRGIMWGHPTKKVREEARKIHDEVVQLWYDTDRLNAQGPDLNQDEASKLESMSEELVQMIHADEPTHCLLLSP